MIWMFPIITSFGASLSGSCSSGHIRNCGLCGGFPDSYIFDIVFHTLNITVWNFIISVVTFID